MHKVVILAWALLATGILGFGVELVRLIHRHWPTIKTYPRKVKRCLKIWAHRVVLFLMEHQWEYHQTGHFEGAERTCVDCDLTQRFNMETLTWR